MRLHPDNRTLSARRLAARVSPLALLTAAAMGAGAAPAFAQSGAAAVEDRVVVTARFREESVQSTPLAITAMSAEVLENKSIENLEDIGRCC